MSGPSDFLLGVDLGRKVDPAAMVLVERHPEPHQDEFWFEVRHVEEFPLGTRYKDVVRAVGDFVVQDPVRGKIQVGWDATGVGAAVMELVEDDGTLAELSWQVTITSGKEWTQDGPSFRVPKADLAASLQLVLQDRRILMRPEVEQQSVLRKQLVRFEMQRTKTGYQRMEGAAGEHDDVALALMVAVWLADHVPLEDSRIGRGSFLPYQVTGGHRPVADAVVGPLRQPSPYPIHPWRTR